jgi:hypothetical protein
VRTRSPDPAPALPADGSPALRRPIGRADDARRANRASRTTRDGGTILALAAGLLLAGCGPTSADATPTAPPAATASGADAVAVAATPRPTIAVVLSYHDSDPWQDGLIRGFREATRDRARLDIIRLDSRRRPAAEDVRAAADEAAARILELRPEVVITCDNRATDEMAARLEGHDIPLVFCGVNVPTSGAADLPAFGTGMIERPPADTVIRFIHDLAPRSRRVLYISGNRHLDQRNLAIFRQVATARGLSVQARLVDDFESWKAAVAEVDESTVVILADRKQIDGWNDDAALEHVQAHPAALSVGFLTWMAPFVDVTFAKVPAEHATWALEAALLIAGGTDPGSIPVVANLEFERFVNPELDRTGGVDLPRWFVARARSISP